MHEAVMRSRTVALLLALAMASAAVAAEDPAPEKPPMNGFDLRKHGVPLQDIRAGGPARDQVEAIDEPKYASLEQARWVRDGTPVIGVSHGGASRALPVHLMEFHQVANDELGGVPVVISFDPLTSTPRAFLATVDGKRLRFGVSGLVYNSGFLMYDHETESLWSQFLGKAIAGPLTGATLTRLGVRQEPLGVWRGRVPDTLVLARPRPRQINYSHSPYRSYWVSETVPFPVAASDERYHPKEVVLGVQVGGVSRAYLGSVMTAAGGRIVDEVAGVKLRIEYDSEVANFLWDAPESVAVTDTYWFAWKAFHPDTEIWNGGGAEPE